MGKQHYFNVNDFFKDLRDNGWLIDSLIYQIIKIKLSSYKNNSKKFEYDEDLRNIFYFIFVEDEKGEIELLISYDDWSSYSNLCRAWICGGYLMSTLWIKPDGKVISNDNIGILKKKENDYITIDFNKLFSQI